MSSWIRQLHESQILFGFLVFVDTPAISDFILDGRTGWSVKSEQEYGKFFIFAILLLFWIFPVGVSSVQAAVLEEIVVTAQKHEESLQEPAH